MRVFVYRAGLWVALGLAAGASGETAAATRPAHDQAQTSSAQTPRTPVAATAETIRSTVRQLSHPSPARRRAAIRQLAEWGPVAFPELKRVAGSENLESALLARDLLEELQGAILIGAEVRMEVQPARAAWNQPVTLTVYAHNPTPGPIRVPWAAPATRPAGAASVAEQPAAMLDAADFLTVTGPDGEALALRVEPIERSSAVYAAVDTRASRTPPSHLVEPGQTAKLVITDFNRGWARYPMLAKGIYTIEFAYQPQWKDESWTQEGFGQVTAKPVRIEITEAAPQRIRQAELPLAMTLKLEGDQYVIRLESTWDHEQWLNLNFGPDLETQAQLDWQLVDPGNEETEPVRLNLVEAAPGFSTKRLVRLRPGETTEIAQVPRKRLEEVIEQRRPATMKAPRLHVRYVHLATPEALSQRMAELKQEGRAPTHLFSGSVSAEPLELEKK